MTLAQRICKETKREFCSIFRHQFILSKKSHLKFEGWHVLRFYGWSLYHCPSLPVTLIKDSESKPCCIFLGIGVNSSGEVIENVDTITFSSSTHDFESKLEAYISSVAGRYCAIDIVSARQRMYFDPVADLGVVYNPETKTVASTMLLALDRDIQNNENCDMNAVLNETVHLSLGQTIDNVVKRALPNHYLDLEKFQLVRHWPNEDTILTKNSDALEITVAEMSTRLGVILRALVANYPCLVPITGGIDSRNLIACGRPYLSSVKQFFVHKHNWASSVDCLIAQLIAEHLNVPLNIVDSSSSEVQALLWPRRNRMRARWDNIYSSGYQSGGRSKKHSLRLAVNRVLPKGLVLRGNVMELMRASVWRFRDNPDGPVDVDFGVKSLLISDKMTPQTLDYWKSEYLKWMEGVPKSGQERIYDLAYIEHRVPNFTATYYGYNDNFYIDPFSDRRLLELTMQIHPRLRKSGIITEILLNLKSPDLKGILTINQFKKYKLKL